MEIIKVKKFDDVEEIAEKLKNSDVTINFSECEDRRLQSRVIDFCAGLVHYTGKMEQIDGGVFLVSLNNK